MSSVIAEMSSLTDPNERRNAILPIRYPNLYDFYKRARAAFWVPQEVDLVPDVHDWTEKLNDAERHFVSHVLAFFASSDFIVNENLAQHFASVVTIPEVQFFYHFQMMMEDIHSEMYAQLIDVYIKDSTQKQKLLDAVQHVPIIAEKAVWARRWIGRGSFVERLIAFAVVEGIFFSGSFCAIFWLKKRGLMPGLTISNEFISRDEGLHRDFACYLYRHHVTDKLDKQHLLAMVEEAVRMEQKFVTDALPVSLIGMNAGLMCQYIEYVADHLLLQLTGEIHFRATNPFEWMTLISLQSKTNFFEHRVSSYAKTSGLVSAEENQLSFASEDF